MTPSIAQIFDPVTYLNLITEFDFLPNLRSPSPECYTTFWMMTIYSDTLHLSGIAQIFDPVTDLNLITEFDFYLISRGFHRTFATGRHATEDAYSSGNLVLSYFGACKCSNVETNPSWICLVSGLLSFEHPSVLLVCLTMMSSNCFCFGFLSSFNILLSSVYNRSRPRSSLPFIISVWMLSVSVALLFFRVFIAHLISSLVMSISNSSCWPVFNVDIT